MGVLREKQRAREIKDDFQVSGSDSWMVVPVTETGNTEKEQVGKKNYQISFENVEMKVPDGCHVETSHSSLNTELRVEERSLD